MSDYKIGDLLICKSNDVPRVDEFSVFSVIVGKNDNNYIIDRFFKYGLVPFNETEFALETIDKYYCLANESEMAKFAKNNHKYIFNNDNKFINKYSQTVKFSNCDYDIEI